MEHSIEKEVTITLTMSLNELGELIHHVDLGIPVCPDCDIDHNFLLDDLKNVFKQAQL